MKLGEKVIYSNPGLGYIEGLKGNKREVAVEFESLLLKELLKEAFRPLLEGKSFEKRLYYDAFLEAIGRKMAEAGGIGIAKFLLENIRDEKSR
ncbi:MAG: hypothetical protein D6674_04200 [Acidobacteria bacterium]|jgi:Rod binding domain-containing protein|nr:MAG: hypothetical protein D6674_04200 [Acidobacteriota bacterium]